MARPIPIARAKELLFYDPTTGILKWREARGRGVKAGDEAGTISANGYIQISLDGTLYRAHRVAFAIYYGRQPSTELDHVDRDTGNNKIANLREATHFDNQHNARRSRNNSTGVKGVHKRLSGKYQASLLNQGKKLHFGYFCTIDDAKEAVRAARVTLHGDFARHE
jgi:hypothetical protein